jgi:hypothetical protein
MAGIPAPSTRVETLAGADEWRNRAGWLGSNPIAFVCTLFMVSIV